MCWRDSRRRREGQIRRICPELYGKFRGRIFGKIHFHTKSDEELPVQLACANIPRKPIAQPFFKWREEREHKPERSDGAGSPTWSGYRQRFERLRPALHVFVPHFRSSKNIAGLRSATRIFARSRILANSDTSLN